MFLQRKHLSFFFLTDIFFWQFEALSERLTPLGRSHFCPCIFKRRFQLFNSIDPTYHATQVAVPALTCCDTGGVVTQPQSRMTVATKGTPLPLPTDRLTVALQEEAV